MSRLSAIAINTTLAEKLQASGIADTDALLAAGGQKTDRTALANQLGVSEDDLLEALNRADLSRIKGVSLKYSNLLEEAGVDTVPELAQRNPGNLHTKMAEVNASKHLVERLPHQSDVDSWVAQAKQLPRAIHY